MPESEYYTLTSVQQQVLTAIGAGETVTAAARAAGVQRNTINYWLRVNHAFQSGLEQVHHDQALHWREQAELLAPKAFENLCAVLDDPKTSPATRVRVSLAIIKMASTPLSLFPSAPEIFPDETEEPKDALTSGAEVDIAQAEADLAIERAERAVERADRLAAQYKSGNLHKVAQISTDETDDACPPTPGPGGEATHPRPQPVRTNPLIHEPDDPCPCGSGCKYKDCCRDLDEADPFAPCKSLPPLRSR